jgi:hypothetical protein
MSEVEIEEVAIDDVEKTIRNLKKQQSSWN